jgi:hypothetical protein
MAFGKFPPPKAGPKAPTAPPKAPKNLSATKGNTMGTSKSKNPFLKGQKTGPNPQKMPGPTTASPMGNAPAAGKSPFGKKGF